MAEQNTTDKLTLAKFEEAYDIVHKVVLPTKLIYSDYFSGITGIILQCKVLIQHF